MSFCNISEMEQIICQLERGLLVTQFSWRRKPEHKMLFIKRETRQIVWIRLGPATNAMYDGAVDWAEIKDIRLGKMSESFEKWSEDAKKFENSQCFVVFYGSEFNLRALSIAAASEDECDRWIRGLKYFVEETRNLPYALQVQAWLRKEFQAMENQNNL